MSNGEIYGLPADVYSFGLFAFEVLSLRRAWDLERLSELHKLYPHVVGRLDAQCDMATALETLRQINTKGLLPDLKTLDEVLTGGAQNLVRSCLRVKPCERPTVEQVTSVIRNQLALRVTQLADPGDMNRIRTGRDAEIYL